MPTTTARILALGGEIRHPPVGRWATDAYLQRTVIATGSFAVLATLLVSMFPALPETELEIGAPQTQPPSIVDIRHYTSPPPSIRQGVTKVSIRKHDFPMPKPVADSEILEKPEIGSSHVGSLIGGKGTPTAGAGETLFEEGWAPSRAAAPEVFLFVEVPPELVSLTNPVYPELAREAGVEGTVHVKVLVSEEGLVLEALVLEGVPLLEEAAVGAARTALFRPAQQSGQPVRTWVVMPIEFSLRR